MEQGRVRQGRPADDAGAKVVETSQGPKTIVIIGLSGTGKTTSTFRRQGNSKPVQDDYRGDAGGVVHRTENGCFAEDVRAPP